MEANAEKKKILIIDDEISFTNMVKRNLEATGKYEVAIENEGKNALLAIRKHNPDIILLDNVIPDLGGANIFGMLRSDIMIWNTPVLFLTASSKEEVEARIGGFILHPVILNKPINMKDLIKHIEENLKRS
ncbi:MAG: response regulator [Candidatus Omnitrophota bacterium]